MGLSFMGDSWSKTQFCVGVVQLCTCFYIVGWVWSIFWGIKILIRGEKNIEGDESQQKGYDMNPVFGAKKPKAGQNPSNPFEA
jgi:hypothetical protein